MLTRRAAAIAKALVIAIVGVPLVAVSGSAQAGESVYCPPLGGPCVVTVDTGGSPGSGNGGGGGNNDCIPGVGCPYDDGTAAFCMIKYAEPQPDASDESWEGHVPPDGAIYSIWCERGFGPLGVPVQWTFLKWFASPPPGAGPASPAQAAAQAINQLGIRGPDIGIAPSPAGSGLVGLPVWLWTAVDPANPVTWGPISATASLPGVSVTATARAVKIVWDMGDGQAVTCDNPGTPYLADYGKAASPSCGYRYTKPSRNQPGGRYVLTGVTTWQVDWAGGGESGTVTVTRASTTTVQINELQVVTH